MAALISEAAFGHTAVVSSTGSSRALLLPTSTRRTAESEAATIEWSVLSYFRPGRLDATCSRYSRLVQGFLRALTISSSTLSFGTFNFLNVSRSCSSDIGTLVSCQPFSPGFRLESLNTNTNSLALSKSVDWMPHRSNSIRTPYRS